MRLSALKNLHAARTALLIGAAGLLLLTIKEEPMNIETETQRTEKHHNRLITEKSPYLFQHADNPVNWYPWSDEAFEKARKEDKPIFLSIGYSTCHWCHVMAHESFENPEVAALMNEVFVSIKVDREERPDIDNVYMTVCQMMTGSGGWPLTIIMTPEKKPFFAATYKALFSLKTEPIKIELDDEIIETKAVSVTVSNMKYAGGGMVFDPGARLDDGLFDICIVREVEKLSFALTFPQMYRDTGAQHPALSRYRSSTVKLFTERTVEKMFDGNINGETPLEANILPEAIDVFVPSDNIANL